MLASFDMSAIPDCGEIELRYRALCEEVNRLEEKSGRQAGSVSIELAAKYQSPNRIHAALKAGAQLLGHNIIQQLVASETALNEKHAPAHRTHVIGHVQKNKASKALSFADCIETVDSMDLALRLNRLHATRANHAVDNGKKAPEPFEIFLQVNSSGAQSQFGIPLEQVTDIAGQIAELDNLRITGLMTIGAHSENISEIAASFTRVRDLRDQLRSAGLTSLRELSMGMSNDMDIAIAEGSTIIRVGTAVFGPRL